jgi:hypothetical protein
MFTITKQTEEYLKAISSNLPTVMVNTIEKHIVTKKDLEDGLYVGAELLNDGTYIYNSPVQIAKNHYRCIKKRYKKGGAPLVAIYIDEINKLKKLQ